MRASSHNECMHRVSTDPAFQHRLDELEGQVAHAAREIEPELWAMAEQAEARGDVEGQGWALVILGGALFHQGRFDEVIHLNETAVSLARKTGDRHLESRALNGLGISRQKLGLYVQAFEHYTRSLSLSRGLSDHVSVVRTLSNLAYLYRVHRQFSQAMALLSEAQELLLRHRHPRYAVSVSGNLAWTHIEAGNYQQALAITQLFLPEAQEQSSTKYVVQYHCAQAVCYLHLKQLPEALSCATRARLEAQQELDADADGISFVTLADVLCAMHDYRPAEKLLLQALETSERSGSVMALANVKAKLAQVYTHLGEQERAFEFNRLFFAMQERLRDSRYDPLGMVRLTPPAR